MLHPPSCAVEATAVLRRCRALQCHRVGVGTPALRERRDTESCCDSCAATHDELRSSDHGDDADEEEEDGHVTNSTEAPLRPTGG
jgi:hypothetical protein